MNSELLLEALGEVAPEDILAAGQAGGYLKGQNKSRPIVRIAMIAAAVLILLAGAVGAKMMLGIWNDRWVHEPSPDPAEVVRSAIGNQMNKEYTVTVEIGKIIEDAQEADKVWAGSRESMLARQNGWTDTGAALAERCGKREDFKAFYAEYTVEYDHTKTFYPDGALGQWFYLTRGKDGNWEIWESSDPLLLDPQEAAEAPDEARAESPLQDPDGAVQETVEMVKAWESFDDVRAITVDRAQCSEEHRQRALELVPGSALAEAEGWTETYLRENLAAVEITWTTQHNPCPDLPDPPITTETAVYYLLRDPDTGQWHNSEITGFMDGK